MKIAKTKSENTSWDKVAGWYDQLIEGEGTYQRDLILPNLLRLMDIKKDETVLDLACGQGFFAREFVKSGARILGVDASGKLIEIAKKRFRADGLQSQGVVFKVAQAERLPFIKDGSVDKVAVVLAIQNIENIVPVFRECARVLAPDGRLFLVMNHPAFRIPKESGWGWDEKSGIQYRRIDRYLSELKVPIQMHPGADPDRKTPSSHRPLQSYFKALHKSGFCVAGLEEWNSHRKSGSGPRARAEDVARKEIPLFLCLVAKKAEIHRTAVI